MRRRAQSSDLKATGHVPDPCTSSRYPCDNGDHLRFHITCHLVWFVFPRAALIKKRPMARGQRMGWWAQLLRCCEQVLARCHHGCSAPYPFHSSEVEIGSERAPDGRDGSLWEDAESASVSHLRERRMAFYTVLSIVPVPMLKRMGPSNGIASSWWHV